MVGTNNETGPTKSDKTWTDNLVLGVQLIAVLGAVAGARELFVRINTPQARAVRNLYKQMSEHVGHLKDPVVKFNVNPWNTGTARPAPNESLFEPV